VNLKTLFLSIFVLALLSTNKILPELSELLKAPDGVKGDFEVAKQAPSVQIILFPDLPQSNSSTL